ncbi:MAG TPA: hypothetical protein VF895_06265 [Gaiellaceae bacterium]
MARIFRYRPIVTALIAAALVSALSVGGATAAGLITGKQIKNHTIRLVDLTKAAQKALKGQRGPRGLAGPQGPQGPAGPAGVPGQAAQAVFAYAHVSKGGSVIGADSKSIKQANLVRTATGQYCFRGLPLSLRSAVASPAGGKAIGAVVGPPTTNCSFVVSTYASNGARIDNAFYVQFA